MKLDRILRGQPFGMMDGRHVTPFPATLGTHPSASKCNIGLQWEFTKTEVTTLLCVILTKYFFSSEYRYPL